MLFKKYADTALMLNTSYRGATSHVQTIFSFQKQLNGGRRQTSILPSLNF